MSRVITLLVMGFMAFSCLSCAKLKSISGAKGAKTELKTENEKASYALGMDIGTQLRDVQSNIDFDAFVQGIRDTLEGKKTLLTPEQAMAIKTEFFQKMQAEKSQKNTSEGDLFLAENKKKPGIIITPSGLQYIILTAGKGPKPVATDKVVVHYSGTLIDGTEFDSSYKRGQPATFVLNQVIPGWTEAIQLMNVGAKYRFFIPSQLAYGERGAGPRIGPNATLIFEVELINIEK